MLVFIFDLERDGIRIFSLILVLVYEQHSTGSQTSFMFTIQNYFSFTINSLILTWALIVTQKTWYCLKPDGSQVTGDNSPLTLLRWLFWVPSIFIQDILVYIFLTSTWLIPSSRSVQLRMVQVTLILNMITCCLVLIEFGFKVETGTYKHVNNKLTLGSNLIWNDAFEILDRQYISEFLLKQSVAVFLSITVMLAVHIIIFKLSLFPISQFQFLQQTWEYIIDEDSDLPLRPVVDSEKKRPRPFRHGRVHCIKDIVWYLFVVFLFRPAEPWNAISSNVLVNVSWRFFSHTKENMLSSFASAPLWTYPSDYQEPWKVTNSHLNRTVSAPDSFRHIVVVVLESARADVMPWNPDPTIRHLLVNQQRGDDSSHSMALDEDGSLLHRYSTGDHSKETNDVTPTFRKIIQDAFSTSTASSVSSYTIKSLISILCGIYPLSVNYNLESGFHLYRDCLPSILKKIQSDSNFKATKKENIWYPLRKYGRLVDLDRDAIDEIIRQTLEQSKSTPFVTAFFQPSDSRFDAQHSTMKKMGFDFVWDRESIKTHFIDAVDETNYFGYSDHDMLPAVLRFAETVHQQIDKRMFITLLTAVSHHPWQVPSSFESMYPRQLYSSLDATLNDYLNTIRYTDGFLNDLMYQLEHRGILNDTLVILTGDHGVAMGHHNRYGSIGNVYESGFRVPLAFFAGNRAWPPKNSKEAFGNWTHLDILPTLLDMLNIDLSAFDYEGESMLRPFRTRKHFALVSPGGNQLIVREKDFKAVFDIKSLLSEDSLEPLVQRALEHGAGEMLFDLRTDLQEKFSLVSEWRSDRKKLSNTMKADIHRWFDEAREHAFHWVRRNRLKYGYNRGV
jgi:hypothetical protein